MPHGAYDFYLCWTDHQQITYDGFQLLGPPDDLVWLTPDEGVPDRLGKWFSAYEAKCTRPRRIFRTREFRPGEKRRLQQATSARAQVIRDARDRLDEDVGEYDPGGSTEPRTGSASERAPNDEPQNALF